ncbi:MAG TPA: hypothetical protein VML00_00815 [Bacteroidota bacterium]|nr:hypothetical protein [Bacteroidota bacterium]
MIVRAALILLVASATTVSAAPAPADSLALENGLIGVRLVNDTGGYRETWFAGAPGRRRELARSGSESRTPLALWARGGMTPVRWTRARLDAERGNRALVIEGALPGVRCTETIRLEEGSRFASVSVRCSVDTPLSLGALLSTYAFSPDGRPRSAYGRPDFVFTPLLEPAQGEVIGDHVFRAPAFILQQEGAAFALVPDIRSIDGRNRPVQSGADLRTVAESRPIVSFGLMDYTRTKEHVYYRRADTTVVTVGPGTLGYSYYIYANDSARRGEAYRDVVRLQWSAFGHPNLVSGRSPQSDPFSTYIHRAWDEFVPQVALDTVYRGVPVTLLRQARLAWSNRLPAAADSDCWFNTWFNALRTAYGMRLYGDATGDRALSARAERVLNLVLAAPRSGGLLPTIFYVDSAGGHWVNDQGWGGIEGGRLLPMFHNAWTGCWLLNWADLVPSRKKEILACASGIASFLVAHQLRSGVIPSWYDPATGDPSPVMRDENAETAGGALFLARYAQATGDASARRAAVRAMEYVFREIVPPRKWFDFETFFSCSPKPVGFYDTVTTQYAQNTLSMEMAAEACEALYDLTGDRDYVERGSAILDYLCLYQQVWSPRWLSRELLGGFGVQNTDAEWSDARQGYCAVTLMDYYRLTGRREYFERGVAALRAMFSLFESPGSPRTAENYGHSGGDDPAGVTGLHWGTGSSVVSIEIITARYGGAWVDVAGGWGAGIDGCTIPGVSVSRDTIRFALIDDVGSGRPVHVKFGGTGGRSFVVCANGACGRACTPDELAQGIDIPAVPRAAVDRRLWAAVLIVRGSVTGSGATWGVYTKGERDTAFTRRLGALSFGLALYDNGRTRRYYVAGGNGVIRSTDGGNHWRILTSWRTEEILCVVPDPVDSAVIYVATPFGVFRTDDDGATWQKKMRGMPTWYVQRVIMDAHDRRTLYAATETDLFRSTDRGEHWRALGSGLHDVLAETQDPARPEILIAAGEGRGMRRTTDGGRSWHPVSGLDSATIYTFRWSPADGACYAAGWMTGLWRSRDAGATWRQVWDAPGIEALYSIFVYPDDAGHILAGTVGSGIWESVDGGLTWRNAGLPGTQVKQIELYP